MDLFSLFRKKLKEYDDTHNFTCDICGDEVFSGERVCAPCRKTLPWNLAEICPLCGRAVGEPGICLECKEKPLEIDKARSCFLHEGEAARLMLRFKQGQKYLFRTLIELLLPLLSSEFSDADALSFVPMTVSAEKRRGYNQSRLLAEALSEQCGKKLLCCAEKRKETEAQKLLGRRERTENLKGCFHVTDRGAVKGKRILIVDDILTTGATASELAETLKRAGAEKVYLITATSVPKKAPFGIQQREERKKSCR